MKLLRSSLLCMSLLGLAGCASRGASAMNAMPRALWSRLLALVGAALLLRLAVLHGVLLDPAVGLQVDEAQYWGWSRDLQWGYYSKPPVIAALIAASTALFGDTVTGVKALSMALHGATALALASLAHAMAGARPARAARAAWWAALIALSNPVTSLLGLAATTDAPLLLCWTLAAAALWRLQQQDRLRDWAWLGLWLGLGLLSKYTMAVLLVTVVGVVATRPVAARHPLGGPALMLAVLALLLAPHLAWNAAWGWPTWRHTADITLQAPRGANGSGWARLGEWVGGQWLLFGPLWALLGSLWMASLAPAIGAEAVPLPLPDTRRSGRLDMGPATRAMQDDDAQNPGLLWLQTGQQQWGQPVGPRTASRPITPGPTWRPSASRMQAW